MNTRNGLRFVALALAGFGLAGCQHARQATITEGMVAAAHPVAAKAGVEMLKKGGNAMDAVAATAFTLGVVEPNASGLGGGGFLVYYDAESDTTSIYDYREIAPSSLSLDNLTKDGALDSAALDHGGMSAAVPGTTRGLLAALSDYGSMDRATVLAPAIAAAENGYPVTETYVNMTRDHLDILLENEAASMTYLEEGLFPPAPGYVLKQPKLATTLRDVAARGEEAIYSEEPAERIAAAAQAAGGIMSADDVMAYEPRRRKAIVGHYRGHDIVTIGPPSSGGLQVIQALNILDKYDLKKMGNFSPEYIATIAAAFYEAEKSAFENVGDPAFHEVPVDEMISKDWTKSAYKRIESEVLQEPIRKTAMMLEPLSEVPGNTTSMVVVDRMGNVATLTQTINHFFGSGVLVPELGVLLNNEMSDFSIEEGSPNFPQGGKIPRSSISPVIVLKNGHAVGALGTPGGTRIPSALTQVILQKIDFGASIQDAIDAPRIYTDSARKRINYESRIPDETITEASGYLQDEWDFRKKNDFDLYFGGAQGIWFEKNGDGSITPVGGADPRRDGIAYGENDL